ncbi:MAG: hypothetical protein IJJ26_00060 [Victivallales bacterium]|nr:hypothetical protein [Victivallales bacterium]
MAKFCGKKHYLLSGNYPQELIDILSPLSIEVQWRYSASVRRNDKGQRLMQVYLPEKRERIVFAYDAVNRKWNSLRFSRMGCYDLDDWLFLMKTEKGQTQCENIFYSLPDLRERFRWRSPSEWELLSMEGGYMLYRVGDGIWGAEYDEGGVKESRLLASAPYLRGIHWSLRVPAGSLGDSSQWQEPRLYPAQLPPREAVGVTEPYFDVTPPPAEPRKETQASPVVEEPSMSLMPAPKILKNPNEPKTPPPPRPRGGHRKFRQP